jgi:hypothetical protein
LQLSGGLYFPTTDLKFTGTSEAKTQKLMIIALNVELHGKTKLSAPEPASGGAAGYTTRAALVY